MTLRYSLQIYGDSSGYSDIGVGLGLLFGTASTVTSHSPTWSQPGRPLRIRRRQTDTSQVRSGNSWRAQATEQSLQGYPQVA